MLPDFHRNPGEGQLLVEERQLLYNTVLQCKPMAVVEIGTWKGGGSTYIIAAALHELGRGILHTIEVDKENHEHAKRLYGNSGALSVLCNHVAFYHGDGLYWIGKLFVDTVAPIGMYLLDGSDDPDETLNQSLLITAIARPDCLLAYHDWDGVKTEAVRDRMTDSIYWCQLSKVQNLVTFKRTDEPWHG